MMERQPNQLDKLLEKAKVPKGEQIRKSSLIKDIQGTGLEHQICQFNSK